MRDVQRRWNAGAKSGAEMEGRLHRAWDAYEEIVSGLKWVGWGTFPLRDD